MGDNTASYEATTRREAEAVHRKAEVARGREEVAAHQVGHCKLQRPDGEEEVEAKLQGGVNGRRRHDNRGNATTSWARL